MCGIFAYIGTQNARNISIAGLKNLEYRGYDSSGIASIVDDSLVCHKCVGKISSLEDFLSKEAPLGNMAIAHTRWATHGGATETNAHPHIDEKSSVAVVHNGIIENHAALRRMLIDEACTFRSETDTEVIAHLINKYYDGSILHAVQETMPLLQGSFAIAVIHKNFPDQIIVAAKESPLAIGVGNGETFIASDSNAFLVHTRNVAYLSDSELAVVKADSFEVYDEMMKQVSKETEVLASEAEEISKGKYAHFMLKEIHEQPQTIRNALLARFMEDYGTATFDGIHFDVNELFAVDRIIILACGTSWHAGCIGAYMLQDKVRIPVQVEISSEFRYQNPVVGKNTLVIAISQSGETADTMAAMRELKAKGARVLGICNVQHSSLAREADACLFLRAGAEIGVASTKAFTSQIVVLYLFTIFMARMRHMSKAEGQASLEALQKLPDQLLDVLAQEGHIRQIAKKYAHYDNFFFLGRRYMYPTALEGALKLKEISYINANGYAAGEMKHGPIALINKDCPTVAFCGDTLTCEKMLSNLREVKARNGSVILFAEKDTEELLKDQILADDIVWLPSTCDELATIHAAVGGQLLAYYIALERGTEIDQPRNLAKSVTVE